MKQQINLYLPEFRKKKDWLLFANMMMVVVAFLVLLLLATAGKYFSSWRLNQEVAAKESSLNEARDRTNALVDSYGVQGEDRQLAEQVRRLEDNLLGKRALLDFLEGSEIGNTYGFSEHLADLSRFHIEGLRLTSINLSGGGNNVVLGGEVTRAEKVPLYLQNLRNGESFNGKTFETLRIANAAEENTIDTRLTFDVATNGGVPR